MSPPPFFLSRRARNTNAMLKALECRDDCALPNVFILCSALRRVWPLIRPVGEHRFSRIQRGHTQQWASGHERGFCDTSGIVAVPADGPLGAMQRGEATRGVGFRRQTSQRRASAPRRLQRHTHYLHPRTIATRSLHLSQRICARGRCSEDRHGFSSAARRAEAMGNDADVRALGEPRRGIPER